MDSFTVPNSVLESYLFANTPDYLFRKMYQSGFIASLVNYETEELASLFKQDREPLPFVALSYAILLALLEKRVKEEEIRDIFKGVSLDWLDKIISLHRQKSSAVTRSQPQFHSQKSTEEHKLNISSIQMDSDLNPINTVAFNGSTLKEKR